MDADAREMEGLWRSMGEAAALFGLWLIRRDLTPRFDAALFRQTLALGSPFVLTAAAYWLFGTAGAWALLVWTAPGRTPADEQGRVRFELAAPRNLRRWSPEDPKLYDVAVSAGADVWRDRVGFRTVAVDGANILLNGTVAAGSVIKLQKDSGNGGNIAIDFVNTEQVAPVVAEQAFAVAVDQHQPVPVVEGEDGDVEFRHHRAQQRRRLLCAQPLRAQGVGQRIHLQHYVPQGIVHERMLCPIDTSIMFGLITDDLSCKSSAEATPRR